MVSWEYGKIPTGVVFYDASAGPDVEGGDAQNAITGGSGAGIAQHTAAASKDSVGHQEAI